MSDNEILRRKKCIRKMCQIMFGLLLVYANQLSYVNKELIHNNEHA